MEEPSDDAILTDETNESPEIILGQMFDGFHLHGIHAPCPPCRIEDGIHTLRGPPTSERAPSCVHLVAHRTTLWVRCRSRHDAARPPTALDRCLVHEREPSFLVVNARPTATNTSKAEGRCLAWDGHDRLLRTAG